MMRHLVQHFIEQHHMIEEDQTIIVATSGGPDSMALLHILCGMREIYNLHVIAVTVDHQLRGEASVQDGEYVASICKQWHVPHEVVSVDVRTYAETYKVSTQVAARTLRYDVLRHMLRKHHASLLAMGHHGDDQIETMLMSMARATTLKGMLGIPAKRPFHHGYIIRPLLCVTKSMVEEYCTENGIDPRIDASNFDPSYERNFIRKMVLPSLKERYDHLHRTIQRYTETVQDDEAYMQAEAEEMFQDVCRIEEQEKRISIHIDGFISYPLPLQRRCYRLTLGYLYEKLPKDLSFVHEDLFMEMMQKDLPNKRIQFPQDVYIEKAYRTLYVYKENSLKAQENRIIQLTDEEGTILLPNGDRMSITIKNDRIPENRDRFTYVTSKGSIEFPLHIRTRKDGDKMTYNGLEGRKKIKDIFIDEKIPRHLRDEQWIVTDNTGEILWLVGWRKNEEVNDINKESWIMLTYEQHGRENEEGDYA